MDAVSDYVRSDRDKWHLFNITSQRNIKIREEFRELPEKNKKESPASELEIYDQPLKIP